MFLRANAEHNIYCFLIIQKNLLDFALKFTPFRVNPSSIAIWAIIIRKFLTYDENAYRHMHYHDLLQSFHVRYNKSTN